MGAFTHETVAAWLLDRVAQYDESSGYPAFVGDLVRGIRGGEVEAAFRHGELDDLMPPPGGGPWCGHCKEPWPCGCEHGENILKMLRETYPGSAHGGRETKEGPR